MSRQAVDAHRGPRPAQERPHVQEVEGPEQGPGHLAGAMLADDAVPAARAGDAAGPEPLDPNGRPSWDRRSQRFVEDTGMREPQNTSIAMSWSAAQPGPEPIRHRLVHCTCDGIDRGDPLLSPLKASYPGFDAWLARCAGERRPCIVAWIASERSGLVIHRGEPGWLKLCTLVVSPGFRGRGMGTALMRACLAVAEGRPVYATTFPSNAGMLRLAARHGFVLAGTLPNGEARLERPPSG